MDKAAVARRARSLPGKALAFLARRAEGAALIALIALVIEAGHVLDVSPDKTLHALEVLLVDGVAVDARKIVWLAVVAGALALVHLYRRAMRKRAWRRFGAMIAAAERGDLTAYRRCACTEGESAFQRTVGRFAFDAVRLRAGLDSCDTMLMVADSDNAITYANPRLSALFEEHLERFRATFPDMPFPDVLGADIGLLNRGLAPDGAGGVKGQIVAGGRRIDVRIDPLFDACGAPLGACAQWRDVTHEIEVESEISNIVDMITMGELDMTMTISASDGVHLRIADGVNQLVAIMRESLSVLNALLGAITTGDLSRRMDDGAMGVFGELAANANATVAKIGEIVADIDRAAQGLAGIVAALRRDAGALAERSVAARDTVSRTTDAAVELTASIEQNAGRAEQARATAASARASADRGGEIAQQSATAMAAIEASSRRVADIASMIDEIAFQTNMLALNAAVEAARAGEAGRGFAVVAQEVRALSGRVADSARDIKQLLQSSTEEVRRGVTLARSSGESLNEIESDVDRLATLIEGVSDTVREQRLAMEVMRDALSGLDEAAQRNAELAHGAAGSADRLGGLTDDLGRAVSFFGGGAAVAGAQDAAPGDAAPGGDAAQEPAPDFTADLAQFQDDAALEAAALAAAGWSEARA